MGIQLDYTHLITGLLSAAVTGYATWLATLRQVSPRVYIRRYVGITTYKVQGDVREEGSKIKQIPERVTLVVAVYNSGAPILINRAELAYGPDPLDVIIGVPEVNRTISDWPVYLDNRTRLRIEFDVDLREYELRVSDLCFLPCWLVAENGTIYKVPKARAPLTDGPRGLVRRTLRFRRLYRWLYRRVDRQWTYV